MSRKNHRFTSIDTFRAMGHLLGYARVSTGAQDAQLQLDALTKAGCYRIFTDTASGALESRPELDKLLDQIRPGDTLVVWRLDRLGRSIRHLINHMDALQQRGIEFKSLQENIDTSSSGGRLVFNIFRHSLNSNEISSANAPTPASKPPEPAAAPADDQNPSPRTNCAPPNDSMSSRI